MAKFIKCDCCGKKIEFGATVYQFNGYCGLYCSPECYADSYADIGILDDDLAENCACTVYGDEEETALRKEIEDTKATITSLELKLKCLEINLKAYE